MAAGPPVDSLPLPLGGPNRGAMAQMPTEHVAFVMMWERKVTAPFRRVTSKAETKIAVVSSLNHALCELTLQRRCLDVSKVSYLLRCSVDSVSSNAFDAFDTSVSYGV